jgi:hypothetical protein
MKKYILILQDEDTYEVSEPKISMIRWGKKRQSEPTLTASAGNNKTVAVPCSMIKELTPIK